MEDEILQEKDTFLKEAIRRVTPVNPGHDFLETVMARVTTETPCQVVSWHKEPLIPLYVKVAFILVFLVLLIAVFSFVEKNSSIALYLFQVEEFISRYTSLFASRLFVLSSLTCAFLFIIQVFIISKKMKLTV